MTQKIEQPPQDPFSEEKTRLSTALDNFAQQPSQGAVYKNGQDTGVRIDYSPDGARMQPNSTTPVVILAQDGVYFDVPERTSEELSWMNIARFMDPRTFRGGVIIQSGQKLPSGLTQITVAMPIDSSALTLPTDYVEWFTERGRTTQEVTFRIDSNNDLIEFDQPNLPPFESSERILVHIN